MQSHNSLLTLQGQDKVDNSSHQTTTITAQISNKKRKIKIVNSKGFIPCFSEIQHLLQGLPHTTQLPVLMAGSLPSSQPPVITAGSNPHHKHQGLTQTSQSPVILTGFNPMHHNHQSQLQGFTHELQPPVLISESKSTNPTIKPAFCHLTQCLEDISGDSNFVHHITRKDANSRADPHPHYYLVTATVLQ